jgi:hypothetical protein
MLTRWNVYLYREGRSKYLGEVSERNEVLARCAALSRFGVSEDEIAAEDVRLRSEAIHPGDDFEVSPSA